MSKRRKFTLHALCLVVSVAMMFVVPIPIKTQLLASLVPLAFLPLMLVAGVAVGVFRGHRAGRVR